MSADILIVDDNPINLKLAGDLLEYEGHAIRRAPDAESALSMIRADPPRLLLLDIQLPGMDGLTLARIIKADETIKHIRIVALTALAMKSDERRAFAAGCDGYIAKPIDARKFPGQIVRHLKEEGPVCASPKPDFP